MNKRLLQLLAFIFICSASVKSQWFRQDFQSSGNVSDYVSSSPDLSRFNYVGVAASNVETSIHQGMFRFRRTSNTNNTGSICRNSNFPGNPKVILFSFDFLTDGAGQAGGNAVSIQFGQNFSNTPVMEPASNVVSQFGFNLTNSSGVFRSWNMANNTFSSNFSGIQKITWVINNDDASANYYAPNGTLRALASKRYDVWIGTSLVLNAQNLTSTNLELHDFKVNFHSSSNLSVYFDNFSVNALNGSFPAADYPVGLNELFPSLTNTNGLFHALNNFGRIEGNTNFNLTSNLTAESGLFPLKELGGMHQFLLKFQPSSAQQLTISNAASVNSGGMIRYVGADNVVFDGRTLSDQSNPNASSFLTINNATSSPTFSFMNGSSNNSIQNCTVRGNANATSNGIVHISTSSGPTGNNNNQILRNQIFGTMNTTRQAIFINGSSGFENRGNHIANNRIYDVYVPSSTSGHIVIGSHIRQLSIENNHLNQTQAFTPGNSATYISCIGGPGGAGSSNVDSVFILNNWIGGSQLNCRGNAWSITTNSVMPLRIRGVDIRFDAGRYALVQGNVVNNINMAFTRTTNTNEFSFRGIYANTGFVDVLNNRIGSRDSLTFTIGTNNTVGFIPIIGIEFSTAAGRLENNHVQGIHMNSISSAIGFEFSGIRIFGNTKPDVKNNLIGSRTIASSIRINNQSTGSCRVYGIQNTSTHSDTVSIFSNRIENLTNFSANANSTLNGIFHNGTAPVKIFNDTITLLTSNGTSTTFGQNQALSGVLITSSGGAAIFQNLIYSFRAENTPNTSVLVSGISVSGTGDSKIFANRIYDIRNESNGLLARVSGINTGNIAGGEHVIYNNMITLGLQTNGTSYSKNISLVGIHLSSSIQVKPIHVYYNTVLVDGAESGSATRNFGFYWGSFSGGFPNHPVHIANNIFNVSRTGTLKYAAGIENNASIPLTLDNNLYFSPNNEAFTRNAVEFTFNTWKSGLNRDMYSEIHNIATPSASLTACGSLSFTNKAQADLHLPMCEIRISSKGRVVSAPFPIYTDIDGDFRRGTDVGADEVHHIFTFTGTVSQAWNVSNNWNLRKVPTCADSVVVAPNGHISVTPAGNVSVQRQPIIASSDTANFMSLNVLSGATFTAQGSAFIQNCWFDGVIRNAGTLILANNTVMQSGNSIQNGTIQANTSHWIVNSDSIADIPLRNVGMTLFMLRFNQAKRNISFGGNGAYPLSSLTIANAGLLRLENNLVNSLKVQSPGVLTISTNAELISNNRQVYVSGFVSEHSTGVIVGDSLTRFYIEGSDNLIGYIRFKPGNQIVKTLLLNRTGTGFAQLDSPLLVVDSLIMQSGILKTSQADLLTLGQTSRVLGNGSLTNYIDGPVKFQLSSLAKRSIPLGRAGRHRPFSVKPVIALQRELTVEYFDRDPSVDGMNTNNHDGELDEVKNIEYYLLLRDGGNEPMDYTFSWGPESQISMNGFGAMRLRMARWEPSQNTWVNQGPDDHSASGNAQSGNVPVYSNTSSGAFTFSTLYANPLPITLIEFKAELIGNDVELNWLTASETNNSHFNVERSLDAINFEKIAVVQGAGNSNTVLKYKDIDFNAALLPSKTLYYRLHQFDFNGESSLSDIVPVALNRQVKLQVLSANFIDNSLGLSFLSPQNGVFQITCYDQSGKLVYNTKINANEGVNQMSEQVYNQLSAGIYTLKLENDAESVATKLIKR